MKRPGPAVRKQKSARRITRKPGAKWRDTDERSSDESVVLDDRGQTQPENRRTAQRTSRTRP